MSSFRISYTERNKVLNVKFHLNLYRKAKIQKALEEMPKTIENWRKVKIINNVNLYLNLHFIFLANSLFYLSRENLKKRKRANHHCLFNLID